jgi:hypothetical protein
MNIQTIAEHSVNLDLLSGGICIDVGCRGFQFSEAMKTHGCEVWAFDMEDFTAPDGVTYKKMAVSNWTGSGFFKDTLDAQAKYLITGAGIPVDVVNINELYAVFERAEKAVDILKLDAEGSEYLILSDPAFQPIPKQISIEFHLHCHRKLHDQYYDKCMENLLKWYEPVQHELTQAHGAGWNYWNSLFIRRDLIQQS